MRPFPTCKGDLGGFGLESREGRHLKPVQLVLRPLPHTDVRGCVCEIGGLLGPSIPACQPLLSGVRGVQFPAYLVAQGRPAVPASVSQRRLAVGDGSWVLLKDTSAARKPSPAPALPSCPPPPRPRAGGWGEWLSRALPLLCLAAGEVKPGA